MRKTIVLLVVLFTASSLFAVNLGIGGGIGTEVTQAYSSSSEFYYKVIAGSPSFDFNVDFKSDIFGLQICLDIIPSSESYDVSDESGVFVFKEIDKHTRTNLLLVPYLSWINSKWTYSFGPVLGFRFYSYTEDVSTYIGKDPYYKNSSTYFVWGASFRTEYSLNKNLQAYMSVPLLINTAFLSEKRISEGDELILDEYSSFGKKSNFYANPKIGFIYWL